MFASYGYEDGSGVYYLTIDTEKCEGCDTKACLEACPEDIFVQEENDWGDAVVAVEERKAKLLKSACQDCMNLREEAGQLPCQAACPYSAIRHTW